MAIRSPARSVSLDGRRQLLLQVALGVVVLGEDDDADVVPAARRLRQVRDTCSAESSRSVPSTRASGSAAGWLGDLGHLVEELLLAGEEVAGQLASVSGAGGGRGGGGDLGVFFGLQFLLRQQSPGRRRGPIAADEQIERRECPATD